MFDEKEFVCKKEIKIVVTTGAETEINRNAKMNFIKFINQKIASDVNLFKKTCEKADSTDFLMSYNGKIMSLHLIDTAAQAEDKIKKAHIIVHFNLDGSGKKINPESFGYKSKSGAKIIHAKGASNFENIYSQVCKIASDKSEKSETKKLSQKLEQINQDFGKKSSSLSENMQKNSGQFHRELKQKQPKPSKFMRWLKKIF